MHLEELLANGRESETSQQRDEMRNTIVSDGTYREVRHVYSEVPM